MSVKYITYKCGKRCITYRNTQYAHTNMPKERKIINERAEERLVSGFSVFVAVSNDRTEQNRIERNESTE